jgi:hypothetical protein
MDRNCNGANKCKADEMNDDDIKDQYYTSQENAALSPIQRSKLHNLCENHSTGQAAASLTELTAEIAELKAAQDATKDNDTLDKPATNRSNSALQRKSKGQ